MEAKEIRKQQIQLDPFPSADREINMIKAGQRDVVEWVKSNNTTPLGSDEYGYYVWKAALEAQEKVWRL